MNKNEALEYIHSINWTFCKPGLERIEVLCKMLGNPQNSLKFIHVAGTNGKGSFCSMLSNVLKESGYRVGLYTSPYIRCFNERMQINGEMISDSELTEITEKIKPIADSMEDKPTEFELVTAIAFEYFSKNKCDYVVLECGLGGRLDSTNIIKTPILSVITGVALDHTAILGNTVEAIAKEKAGIIKTGIPCLWCGESKGALDVIKEQVKEKNAPLYMVDRKNVNVKKQTLLGTFFDYDDYNDIKISLIGSYQIVNATNVLSAIEILKSAGVDISRDAIYKGLSTAKWQARFELLSKEPLVIFDGGHNREGVDSCIDSVKQYFGDEKVLVLTGVMVDKDYEYIASKICTVAGEVFCITPNNPRALSSHEYKKEFLKNGVPAHSFDTVNEAVKEAVLRAKKLGMALVCTGSLYMYSEIADSVENCMKS